MSNFGLCNTNRLEKGIVIKSTGSWYNVRKENGEDINCRIKGKFRIQGIRTTNPIAVGDVVEFKMEQDDTGVITKIEPRKNYIIRKSVNLSKQAHIIAANIDQALLVITMTDPPTSTGFIDRFLVTAEAYEIPVVLLFNKVDLYDEKAFESSELLKAIYGDIGYQTYDIIATDLQKVGFLNELMKDKTTLISGHSGVGKSTLINTLDPDLDLKVGEISSYHHKGQHTTTFAEMHLLKNGGYLIDTPGIKGLGVIDIEKNELAHFFPEMMDRLNGCKFHNCLHINEPGCSVKAAIEDGEIAISRYESYLSIYHDDTKETFR